jgi:membrane protein implicated in regulation of membrane protease activity
MTYWTIWWVWIAFALTLAILETLAPAFVFAGMTIGATVIGILLALGVTFGQSFPWALATFGALSLIATLALRFRFGPRRNETRIIRDDINR